MVPPLLLDVQRGDQVLDLCASPGSKTMQILETLEAKAGGEEEHRGLVVANDSDYRRAHLLVARAARLRGTQLVVTNHDARRYPEMVSRSQVRSRPQTGEAEGEGAAPGGDAALPRGDGAPRGDAPLRFDRVLCDVPCSGDGTMRKSPELWRRWAARIGSELHPTQLAIACRAARLVPAALTRTLTRTRTRTRTRT